MSKTDHARIPGTHRAARRWHEPLADRALATRAAIDEGLAEYHAPIDLDETYVPECTSEWEFFAEHPEHPEHPEHDDEMAEWERILLGLDAGDTPDVKVAWASEVAVDDVPLLEVEADDEDVSYPGEWLTGTIAEAFPDYAFVVEGTSARERSDKASGYMRVYELAREVGIDTRHVVTLLRTNGEWVAGPTAYVALPVCKRVLGMTDVLVAVHGPRATPKTWAQQREAWDARFRRPGLSRPLR